MRKWFVLALLLFLLSIVGLSMGLSFTWASPAPSSLSSHSSVKPYAPVPSIEFLPLPTVMTVDKQTNLEDCIMPEIAPLFDFSEWIECIILVGNARLPVWLESHSLPVHRVNDNHAMGQLTALSAAVVHDQNALVVLEDFSHKVSMKQLNEFFSRVRREHANFWHVLVLESQLNFRLQSIPTRLGAYIVHRNYHSQLLDLLFEQCVEPGNCQPNIEKSVWLAVQSEPELVSVDLVLVERPHILVISEEERRLATLHHPQAFLYHFMYGRACQASTRGRHHRTLSRQHLMGVTYVWDEMQWGKLVQSRHINQCFRCTVSGELVSMGENVIESVALFLLDKKEKENKTS